MSIAEKLNFRSTTSCHFLSLTICVYGASNIWWPHYRGEIIGEFSWEQTKGGRGCLILYNYNFQALITRLLNAGLLIFGAVAKQQNWDKSVKSREIHKNTQNTAKFGRNLIKYMSVQQFWNLSQLLGVFTCRKLANLCQNFVTETCKQRSETTRRRLCCGKLVHFWSILLLKEQMMTSVRKTFKMQVWSAQNRLISSEICPENNRKICCFFTDCFPAKFTPKNFREIGRFFCNFVP